jgi:hypothetical protein
MSMHSTVVLTSELVKISQHGTRRDTTRHDGTVRVNIACDAETECELQIPMFDGSVHAMS